MYTYFKGSNYRVLIVNKKKYKTLINYSVIWFTPWVFKYAYFTINFINNFISTHLF